MSTSSGSIKRQQILNVSQDILVSGSSVWHAGNLAKSEFTPASHIGTGGTSHAAVTTTVNGFMIASDKLKLDGISAGATKVTSSATNGNIKIDAIETIVYTHPTGDGNLHIPVTGIINNTKVLKAGATAGSISWGAVDLSETTGTINDTQHGNRGGGSLHAIATQSTHGFISSSDKTKLDNIQVNSINQSTADSRYLQLTGGTLTSDLTISNTSNARLIINADTDNDGVEDGQPILVMTQDGGITGAEIKLVQGGAQDNALVLAPFIDYNTVTPVKNYSVFVHDKKIWHEGNFLKSEFTPASHAGTGGVSHAAVTTSVNGFMISTDKSKLDGITASAKKVASSGTNGNIRIDDVETVVYTHPSGDGNLHVPATSTSNNGKFLKAGATAGNISWTQVAFADISGPITAAQHAAQTDETLHAVATTSTSGFLSSSDKTKLDGIQSSAINQTTADGRYLQLTGGTISNNLTVTGALMANGDIAVGTNGIRRGGASSTSLVLYANGGNVYLRPNGDNSTSEFVVTPTIMTFNTNQVWHAGNFTPTNKSDVGHTHTVANITDLATNYYDKTAINNQMASKGDVFLTRANAFTDTNTFTKSGVAIKVQPATAAAANSVLLQINNSAGTNLVTMGTNASGETTAKVVINGDLEVTGSTIQKSTQDIQGDMNVSGNLNVTGNAILGDGASDQATIKGDLRLEGNFLPIGKYLEVCRVPIFGIADDFQFETDSLSFSDIISSFSTFDINGGSAFVPVSTGGIRYYKIMVSYASNGTDDSTLRIVQESTTTEVISFTLPAVNAALDVNSGLGNKARTWMSAHFSTAYSGSTTFQAKKNVSGNLGIRYIELIAYDYYA